MTTTPIEDRIAWAIHRAAVAYAEAAGLCWQCCQLVGFSKTDVPMTTPALCPKCQKKHATRSTAPMEASCR